MLDELKEYFELVSKYRSTQYAATRKAIVMISLPRLFLKTNSMRLKNAIDSFLKGNTDALQAG